MRRLLALPLLLAAAAVLAGCGTGGTTSAVPAKASSAPPDPGDLAADAVAALDRITSAHYALDASFVFDPAAQAGAGAASMGEQPIELHVEGDGSPKAGSADVTVEAAGQRFAAKIVLQGKQLYVNFLGTWYGGDISKWERPQPERDELATADRVRTYFEEVFTGSVEDGPLMDGQPTWAYAGTLDADGLARLAQEFGRELSAEERDQLAELGQTVELRFLVGKEDSLPRRIELEVDVGKRVLDRAYAMLDSLRASVAVRLSEFGKQVTVEPPAEYRPLEELGAHLGSGV